MDATWLNVIEGRQVVGCAVEVSDVSVKPSAESTTYSCNCRPSRLRRTGFQIPEPALSARRLQLLAKDCEMLKVRVIPCLDVKDGRIVKGVNFVNLIKSAIEPERP